MNLDSLFSGSALSTKANASKEVKSMKDGIAKIVKVEPYTSKRNNSLCAKISFQDMSAPNDPNRGHDEYLSTREGARFLRVIERLKYLPKIAGISNVMESLPSFFEDITDENGVVQNITFKTNDELTSHITKYGNDVTFFWLKDVQPFVNDNPALVGEELKQAEKEYNKTRVLVRWANREQWINLFCTAFNQLVGKDFKLKFNDNEDNDFRSLKKILPTSA